MMRIENEDGYARRLEEAKWVASEFALLRSKLDMVDYDRKYNKGQLFRTSIKGHMKYIPKISKQSQ